MKFADIPGLTFVKQKLISSVQTGKVAHAQLFMGNPGALNLPLALAYATYLHCQDRTAQDSCGVCAACSKSLKYVHPDTHFVFPMGNMKGDSDDERSREKMKSETLKTWRSFLLAHPFGNLADWVSFYGGEDKQINISKEESRNIIRTLALKPFESPYKIMVIWQPEFMHPTAANGILKILEEPPPQTFFVLVTNAVEQLLPTILSRVQILNVPMMSDELLEEYLNVHKNLDEPRRKKIVQLADGSLNEALLLMETEQDSNQDQFAEWMRSCFQDKYGRLVTMSEEFHELDKLSQRNTLQYALAMMRETLLYISGASEINRVRGGELEFISNFGKRMDVLKIEKCCSLINLAQYHVERNGSAKMIFLDLSIEMAKAMKS